VAVPPSEWVHVARPELAIIDEPLWQAVKARQAGIFASYLRGSKGRLQGRPEHTVSAHLLTGFVVCYRCGGRMVVWSATSAKARRARPDKPAYRTLVCWRHKSGGDAACTNYRAVPLQALTDVIVEHFRSDVLTPERVAQVARDLAADAESAPERVAQRRAALESELRRLDQRLAKLTEAVAEGGALKTLTDAIRQAEGEQREAQAKLEQLDATQAMVARWDTAGQQGKVQALLSDWQAALTGSPMVGRQILRKLLVSPITVEPQADGSFWYSATGSYARVITGTIGGAEPKSVTIKRGGVERADDLAAELKVLAAAQAPGQTNRSGGSRGRTS
jgi:recombinase-like zinc beta ribbon protein